MRLSKKGPKANGVLGLWHVALLTFSVFVLYMIIVWISSAISIARANDTTASILKEIKGRDLETEDKDSSHHFLATNKDSISDRLCTSRDFEVVGVPGFILPENYKKEVLSTFTSDPSEDINFKRLVHYQLCFSSHSHQHQFRLALHSSPSKELGGGDCDMILSSSHPFPKEPDQWQWKSTELGPDSLTLDSYLAEFQASKTQSLFITVAMKPQSNRATTTCTLSVEVATLENDTLLKKIGLRGGQRLLPRDIKRIIRGQQ